LRFGGGNAFPTEMEEIVETGIMPEPDAE